MENEESEKHLEELRRRKFIDASKLTLDEWLALLNPDSIETLAFIYYQFPTKTMRDEYINTVNNRSDKEVKDLIRNFLIPSGSLGTDSYLRQRVFNEKDKKRFEELFEIEHIRRVCVEDDGWEGNTWILDLLPDNPKLALDAIWAYIVSHIQFLPDGRIDGLRDAMSVIRAKFVENPRSSVLSSLDHTQFQLLIDALYRKMGYKTTITQKTHDGGKDVIAEKEYAGRREKVYVQCKTNEKNIDVDVVRNLLGVVSDEKATKGVVVCTSEFTSESIKFEAKNYRLELIGNKKLQELLNEYLGPNWSVYVDLYISERYSKSGSVS
jgi:restriction system protein